MSALGSRSRGLCLLPTLVVVCLFMLQTTVAADCKTTVFKQYKDNVALADGYWESGQYITYCDDAFDPDPKGHPPLVFGYLTSFSSGIEKSSHTLRVWASKYRAGVVAVQQRYTQSSYPTLNLTDTNVQRYQTIEQNLNDMLFVSQNTSYLSSSTDGRKPIWVWFGVAFDGNFVAWHRATNAVGSLMSVSIAAPIFARMHYPEYDLKLSDAFDAIQPGCAFAVHNAAQYISSMSMYTDAVALLKGTKSQKNGLSGMGDVMYVVSRMSEAFVNYLPGAKLCADVIGAANSSMAAHAFAENVPPGLFDAYNVFANSRSIAPPATSFLTVYALKCAHLAQFQTSTATNRSIYSTMLDDIWYLDACKRILGYGSVPAVELFNTKFNGGASCPGPHGTNMVFIGSEYSMTRGLEIQSSLSTTQDAFTITDRSVDVYADILAMDNVAAETKSDVRKAHAVILARLDAALQELEPTPKKDTQPESLSPGIVVMIVVLCLGCAGGGLLCGYCLWKKRKAFVQRHGNSSTRYETLPLPTSESH
eukprot:ANDGO_01464.mRNA.1 Putative serine protease F56F10.1